MSAFLATVIGGLGLPGFAAAVMRPGLALGSAGHGYTRWRLEGRRLTVFLPGRPSYYGFRGTVTVRAVCGDDAAYTGVDPVTEAGNPAWATVAAGRGRVAGQARVVRVVLSRDVANRVNLCTLTMAPGADFQRDFVGGMTVRSARLRGCIPGPLEHVVLSRGRVRVSHTPGYDASSEDSVDAYRACLAPGGTFQPIDSGGSVGHADGVTYTVGLFTSAGTWLAWADTSEGHDAGGLTSASVEVLDLAAPGRVAGTIHVAPIAGSQIGNVVAVAVGATGTVAWEVDLSGRQPTSPGAPVELYAQRHQGVTVTLDRAPSAAIRDLAINPDGQTITWTNAGTSRRAQVP